MLTPKSPEELKQMALHAVPPSHLSSGHPLLDEFLDGGLRWGELSEWGMPWGQSLRDVILWFLIRAQQAEPCWILWIYGQPDISINPLAWQARGLDLNWIRFARAQQPLHELKPVFLSPFFCIIVIDAPQRLADDDCAFLARQARRQQQMLIILRPHALSPGRGNVWAKMRVNCWHDLQQQRIFAKIVKGRRPRQIMWPIPTF